MLKTKSKALLILLFILLLVSSCCLATEEPQTEENTTETTPVEEEYQYDLSNLVTEDLYIAEDTINISNLIEGNVFAVGKEVTVSGEIVGNLFVIANKLVIDGGYVYNGLFACANEIIINGVYINDIYAVCDDFRLENGAINYRDLRVAASNVNIAGRIGRNAYITAKTLSFAEDVEANIYGDLHYSTPSEVSIRDGAVYGEVHYNKSDIGEIASVSDTILYYATNLLQTLFLTFVVTMLLVWLTPKFVDRVANSNVSKSFICLGIGIVAPIVFIFAAILLALTSIGSSVAILGIFVAIVLFYISFSITSIYFGKLFAKLFKMEGMLKFVLLTLASSIVLWVICKIPVIGGFFSIIISLFGVGTTLVNIFSKKEKSEVAVEE